MARTRRELRAGAYLRLYTYMPRRDRVYVLCAFARLHADLTSTRRRGNVIVDAIARIAGNLGLTGAILAAMLNLFVALQPDELAECDRLLEAPPEE